MPIERPSRARGAQPATAAKNSEAPTEEFVKVPASQIKIGDLVVFDQQRKPSEVVALATEAYGDQEEVVRLFSSDTTWLIKADHEVRKLVT